MLLRASISEIKNGRVTKRDGHLVVTMRHYPRFLSKSLIDDYKPELAPEKELFARYREIKKTVGDQSEAFERAQYQNKFTLSEAGLTALNELTVLSREKAIYMICQCEKNERCHVDLMLLIAENKCGAAIGSVPFDYAEFRKRLPTISIR
ncbi:MAG: DUF488 family protein [Bdellovibrionaceae bacterium]|nr:DUF488 family protein [Pseudobdellovibrionaceae bacterium]